MESLHIRLKAARAHAHKTQQDIADACKISRSAVNQWERGPWTGDNGEKHPAKLPSRENLAIAATVTDVNVSWLLSGEGSMLPDSHPLHYRHRLEDDEQTGSANESSQTHVADNESITVCRFDTGGRMGDGGLSLEGVQPGIINSFSISKEWAQENVRRITSLKNLAIVTGFGDSMRPTYGPGDPLLIDTGVTTIDSEGVYFFRIGNDGFIKRLQRIPGNGIKAKSDNAEKYDAWMITEDMDFEVFGRIVKAWTGEDL